MLERNQDQDMPSESEFQDFLAEFQVESEPWRHPALDKLLELLRFTHVNGGAEFASFKLATHPVLSWFVSRGRFHEMDVFEQFLALPTVVASLPELAIEYPFSEAPEFEFEWGRSFTLDGEIAQTLVVGGAYDRFTGTAKEAKEIGMQFCNALFDGRFTEVEVCRTSKAWTHWFRGYVWDHTWLGVDKREQRIWLLCVTDTD
jgi:hypothetical protein